MRATRAPRLFSGGRKSCGEPSYRDLQLLVAQASLFFVHERCPVVAQSVATGDRMPRALEQVIRRCLLHDAMSDVEATVQVSARRPST